LPFRAPLLANRPADFKCGQERGYDSGGEDLGAGGAGVGQDREGDHQRWVEAGFQRTGRHHQHVCAQGDRRGRGEGGAECEDYPQAVKIPLNPPLTQRGTVKPPFPKGGQGGFCRFSFRHETGRREDAERGEGGTAVGAALAAQWGRWDVMGGLCA